MTSYLKILPLFMMVMPGMISRVLFPGKCQAEISSLPRLHGAGEAFPPGLQRFQRTKCPTHEGIFFQ